MTLVQQAPTLKAHGIFCFQLERSLRKKRKAVDVPAFVLRELIVSEALLGRWLTCSYGSLELGILPDQGRGTLKSTTRIQERLLSFSTFFARPSAAGDPHLRRRKLENPTGCLQHIPMGVDIDSQWVLWRKRVRLHRIQGPCSATQEGGNLLADSFECIYYTWKTARGVLS